MSFPRLRSFLVFAALAVSAPTAAQDSPPADTTEAPAVLLDVHRLSVDSLALTAGRVEARLNIDASVAELLQIEAGLSVDIDSVHVVLTGVDAAADLRVHLDVVARVLLEALGVVDRHPTLMTPNPSPESAAPGPQKP